MTSQLQSKKLLLLLLCSIILPTQTITPAQQELITILNSTRIANHYWATLESQKTKHFWQSAPWHWFSSSRKKEITEKRHQLKHVEETVASLLGQSLDDSSGLTKQAFCATRNKAKLLLKKSDVPSYFKRHWLSYTLAAAGCLSAYLYFQSWVEADTLFIIQGRDIQGLIDASSESLHYHYTRDTTYQYLRVEKKDEKTFESILKSAETQGATITKRTPTLEDTALFCYDTDGNNIIKQFYEENGIRPLVSIKKILFKENPNERVLASDVDYMTQQFIKDLDTLIEKAHLEPRTQAIVENHLQNRTLKDIPLATKRNILADIIALAHKEVPEVFKIVKELKIEEHYSRIPYKAKVDALFKLIIESIHLFEDSAEKNTDFFILSFEALFLHFIQRDLQVSVLMNKLHNISDKLNLNFELMATIPAMVLTYGIYRIAITALRGLTGIHILTPLKKDLIQFQLLLNKKRHTTDLIELTYSHKGMCFYWIEKLKTYSSLIKSDDRTHYKEYLNQLSQNNQTPAQKIAIIECMFREFEFLR